MAVREPAQIVVRGKWIADLLKEYPPVRKLEELMGPEPTPAEADEVNAFLQARALWQQPYSEPKEPR